MEHFIGVDIGYPMRIGRFAGGAPPIDHAGAHGELALGFHRHMAIAAAEKFGKHGIGDGAGVVQGAAFEAEFLRVEALVALQNAGQTAAVGVGLLAQHIHARGGDGGFVGDIERQNGDGHAALQHHLGGMRVDIKIEFSRWGDVAGFEIIATHQHDVFNRAADIGRKAERLGDVG